MPNISYFDVQQLEDPELREALERSAQFGTPRPESQAIRAHVPAVLRSFSRNWERVFRSGVCDHAVKELCRVYVSKSVECQYCGAQRSHIARVVDEDVQELLDFETSDRFDDRQKAALAYTAALVWNPESADDALWERLRAHFSEEELVELSYFVALTFGQQRWIKTLAIGHHEVLDRGNAGLAESEAVT